jgi:uncharacterized transporter YbjL
MLGGLAMKFRWSNAVNRLAFSADKINQLLSAMPVAYAVTYIFGTVGAALVLSQFLPRLMRIDLKKACKDYESIYGKTEDGTGTSWHEYELRAYEIRKGNCTTDRTVGEFGRNFPDRKVFVEGIRRKGTLLPVGSSTVLNEGDIRAVVGLSAGPNFVAGLKQLGIGLFLWGIFAATMPLVCGALTGSAFFLSVKAPPAEAGGFE